MTPEKLSELEELEAAVTPGEWRHLMLRADVRDLFSALREAWRERDEARAALAESEKWRVHWETLDALAAQKAIDGIKKERDEARADYQRQKAEALDLFAAWHEERKQRDELKAQIKDVCLSR